MESINKIKEFSDKLKENIGKVIIGKEDTIGLLLTALLARGHVLLEDVPGTGKTVLAKSMARSIGGRFKRIQFTPDLLPSDVTGLNYYNPQEGCFTFRPGPVFTNILLADEINRATPRTQSSLLECMEEKQVTIDGETRELSVPFMVIATQNPIETAGTFPLPEAQMDRFMMQLSMGFPGHEEELDIIDRFLKDSPLMTLAPVLTAAELLAMQEAVKEVYVHELVRNYIVDIVEGTRKREEIAVGASPRGTLALLGAARAHAAIEGRNYTAPEDVKETAPYVLAHRLVLKNTFYKAKGAAELVCKILEDVTVPTEDFRGGRHG